jgi:hypothetical protein
MTKIVAFRHLFTLLTTVFAFSFVVVCRINDLFIGIVYAF